MLKRKSRLKHREFSFKDFLQITEETERIRKETEYRTSLRQVNDFIASQTEQLVEKRWNVIHQLDVGKAKHLFKEKNEISSQIDRLYRLRDVINNCQKKFVAISRINKSSVRESYSLPLTCGSMLCPRCSKNKSKVHHRKVFRIARWMLQIRDRNGDMQPFHSIVFSLPLKLRSFFTTKLMLDMLFKCANETLMEVIGPEGCVMALHFYGHKSDEFNPHVNCVFSGVSSEERLPLPTFLTKPKLKELRETFLSKVLESVPGVARDQLIDADDKYIKKSKEYIKKKKEYIKKNSNCHRSIRLTEGEKKHNLLYIFRGTLPLEKLEDSSQEVKDLFLLDLSPCKDGLTKGGRGKGFRNVRYFGAYRCSNRKKFLEENGIVVPENPGFKTIDDDIEFEIITYEDGKPRLFNFDGVVLGEVNFELGLQQVYLDDDSFGDEDDDYD